MGGCVDIPEDTHAALLQTLVKLTTNPELSDRPKGKGGIWANGAWCKRAHGGENSEFRKIWMPTPGDMQHEYTMALLNAARAALSEKSPATIPFAKESEDLRARRGKSLRAAVDTALQYLEDGPLKKTN